MKLLITLLAISATVPCLAQARKLPASFCASAQKIGDSIENCVENQKFIDAAEDCLEKLEKTVEKENKALEARLRSPKGNSQTKNFDAAIQDYQATSAHLDYLIRLASLASAEAVAYLDQIVEPEHAYDPDENGGDPEAYMEDHPCFTQARDDLNDIIDDIEHRQAELEEAKDAVDAKGAASGLSRTGLDAADSANNISIQSAPPKAAPAGKGATIPKGKDPRASDISGTKDKEEKK